MCLRLHCTTSHVNVQSEGGVLTSSAEENRVEQQQSPVVFNEIWVLFTKGSLFSVFISMNCIVKDDLFKR